MAEVRIYDLKTGKKKIRWGRFCLIAVFLYIAALTIPYVQHKKVSDHYKKLFDPQECYSEEPGKERAAYITDNTEALEYRLKMIREAKEEVIVSTFDFNADTGGKDVMSALIEAAHRNVHVRLIVDGISGFLDMLGDPYFQALASTENIEVKVYNPVNLLKPWTMQARLHDKYVITDSSMYLLGGRNTTNLFLGDYGKHQNIDKEIFIYAKEGESASLKQLKAYFERVWELSDSKEYLCKKKTDRVQNSLKELEERYPKLEALYPDIVKTWDWEARTVETAKVTLLSNPIEAKNKEPHMWYSVNQLLQTGKNAVICTPYIICGKEMYADLKNTCEQVTNVEIITNDVSSGANPWGCTDYLNQKEKIWATGVQVHEYLGPHSNHTKAVLIDDRLSIVGSYNLDMRSTYQDTELMLAIDSEALAAELREEIDCDKTYSRTMTDSGEYHYEENYHPREMSTEKKIFYAVLRVITIPIRRFL